MRLTRRSLALGGLTMLGAGALSGGARADTGSTVRDVAIEPSGTGVRVVLALDTPTTARTFFLTNPDRFVIDVAGARSALSGGRAGGGAGAGVVRGYRYAPQSDGSWRLVLDLEAPAGLVRQELGTRRAPALSFDLAPLEPRSTPPRELSGRNGPRRTVVIDAGHGGRDPGAVGATGVREKDVVLDAALQLRAALESQGRYRVALTRDADRFVALDDRVRFARTQNADLFISIHADSHANPESQGVSVYTLSERGADRAQSLMGAQNWDLDLGEAPRQGVTHDILLDLYQRETTNRSAQFAQTLIPRLGAVAPLLRNTHRNAGFFVLLAPDVPAVLIETGFLSNVTDERRLSDPRARQQMAQAMAEAVDAYFAGFQLYAGRA